jgi:hypothetical protein
LNYKRITILSIIFISIGCFALFDYHRVFNDFTNLKFFLSDTWYSTTKDGKSFIVRFKDKEAELYSFEGIFIRKIQIPTLYQINYNTTKGDNMIIFTPRGTQQYNTRIHGGDIRLKSWFGFNKSIAVNCNGYVIEGVYPEES